MAFMKYANAQVIHPRINATQWRNIRTAGRVAQKGSDLDQNLIVRASDLFKQEFKPVDFLLTHATIIASVDAFAPQGIKTGSQLVDGFRVNRRFSNFRIKLATEKFINNNNDAWNRDVLLKAYPTFVGGHNFVEHIQVEELSKGRIIDAVARDIGDSIYVDILIATDRKHDDLIKAIENGRMGTLSMGCTVDGTICTKCGHWAADETEMCPHIKYEKGNTFFDEAGQRHRVAELCGHESLDPHGGVYFVEASWVEQPAFTGAVLRNVLTPTEALARQAQKILASPPPQWSADAQLKAASTAVTGVFHDPQDAVIVRERDGGAWVGKSNVTRMEAAYGGADPFLAGWNDEGEGAGDTPPPAAPAKDKGPLDQVEEDLEKHLLDKVVERVKEKMKGPAVEKALNPENSSMAPNDNIVKEGSAGRMYRAALNTLVRKASCDADLVNSVAEYNQSVGINIPVDIYRTALMVGAHKKYSSVDSFWSACCRVLGRVPSSHEAKTILRIAKLLSQRVLGDGIQGSRQEGGNR